MQKRCELLGLGPLSPAAMAAGNHKPVDIEHHREQTHSITTKMNNELVQLRADHDALLASYNALCASYTQTVKFLTEDLDIENLGEVHEGILKSFRDYDARAEQQDEVIRQLREEVASLKLK